MQLGHQLAIILMIFLYFREFQSDKRFICGGQFIPEVFLNGTECIGYLFEVGIVHNGLQCWQFGLSDLNRQILKGSVMLLYFLALGSVIEGIHISF